MTVQEMITFMVKQLLECALFSKTKEGFGLSVKSVVNKIVSDHVEELQLYLYCRNLSFK